MYMYRLVFACCMVGIYICAYEFACFPRKKLCNAKPERKARTEPLLLPQITCLKKKPIRPKQQCLSPESPSSAATVYFEKLEAAL